VIDSDLAAAAQAYALELAGNATAPRRLSEVVLASSPSNLFDNARAALGRHPSGSVAPLAAIAAVEAAVTLPFAQGLVRESELFVSCYQSPAAKALWHVFFAERKAARVPDIGPEIAVKKIQNIVVIGAGTMGRGIVMSCLNAGLSVALMDSDPESLQRGLSDIDATYASAVKRGKLSELERKQRLSKLYPTLNDDALSTADLVIEAVFESMAIKRQVFARLDERCAPGTILASNTSTLDLNQIAAATSRPQDVVGLHFFSPAHVMRLLEIVRGEHTSREVIASAFAFAKRIGKVAVQARVCFGFIGNRMIEVYLEEALALLLEGATPSQVDHALEAFGMAMGPFTMADLAGLDVGYRIRRERELSQEQRRLFRLPDALVELGRLGQKTQSGFYLYPPGVRKPQADAAVVQLIARIANELAVAPREHTDEEIVERCLLRLINEGADILSEGIALRAGDIDTVYVNGYGFPAHRGGPMFVASNQGFAYTVARLEALQQSLGARFRPAAWLRTAATAADPVT
jgi:3-hydroxyacyl-CoA dehydrogenase